MTNRPVYYSICATTYNCADMIEESIKSIIQRTNVREIELVICDSKSTDGTLQLIQKYSNYFRNLKIVSKKCTRGEGRQIAFEKSTGQYIILVDLDTIYTDAWKKFVQWHMKYLPDFAVQTIGSGIYPRRLIKQIGGWKNLNYSEDLDIFIKVAKLGWLRWSNLVTGYNFALLTTSKKISPVERGIRWLIQLRDLIALHRINIRQYLSKYGYHPVRVAGCLLSKIFSLNVTGVVDVRKYNRDEVIQKNIIKLPIEGIIGKWYRKGFTITNESLKDKDCLICGKPIPLSDRYCPRCYAILKKEHYLN